MEIITIADGPKTIEALTFPRACPSTRLPSSELLSFTCPGELAIYVGREELVSDFGR